MKSETFHLAALRHASDLLGGLDLEAPKTKCYEFYLRTNELSKKLLALKR